MGNASSEKPRTWKTEQQSKQNSNPNTNNHSHSNKPKQPARQIPPALPQSTDPNRVYLEQFGPFTYIDKNKKQIVKQLQVFEYEREFTQMILQKRSQLKHPNFITLNYFKFEELKDNPEVNNYINQQKGLYICYPSSKLLRIYFQPVVFNLQGLVMTYCQRRQPIQQTEIKRIMKCVVQCLIFLQNNHQFHGDIKPKTIWIHPKTKHVSLLDSYLIHNGRTNYEIIAQNTRAQSFLTPEQLQRNKERKADSLKQVHQAQVFGLGLTMIEIMTIEASMQAYNLQTLQIKPQFVTRKLEQIQACGYSYQLADLALRCIHKNSSYRPKFEQILRQLN